MGDRANVYIHEGASPGVYIYTHWYGTELPHLVLDALATPNAQRRSNDAPYLTRILIEELLRATQSLGEEAGWGVSAVVGDGSDRIVDLDVSYSGIGLTLIGYDEEYGSEEDEDIDDYDIVISYN